jgi:hypothetical protein
MKSLCFGSYLTLICLKLYLPLQTTCTNISYHHLSFIFRLSLAFCCYDKHLTCIANNEDRCKGYSACDQLYIDDETDISSSNASTAIAEENISTAPDNSTMIEKEIGNSTNTNTTDTP